MIYLFVAATGAAIAAFLIGVMVGAFLFREGIEEVEVCFYPKFSPPQVLAYKPGMTGREGSPIVRIPTSNLERAEAASAYNKIAEIIREQE